MQYSSCSRWRSPKHAPLKRKQTRPTPEYTHRKNVPCEPPRHRSDRTHGEDDRRNLPRASDDLPSWTQVDQVDAVPPREGDCTVGGPSATRASRASRACAKRRLNAVWSAYDAAVASSGFTQPREIHAPEPELKTERTGPPGKARNCSSFVFPSATIGKYIRTDESDRKENPLGECEG